MSACKSEGRNHRPRKMGAGPDPRRAGLRQAGDRCRIQPLAGQARRLRPRYRHSPAPDLNRSLPRNDIEGAILTVPNEQHLPVAIEVAKAGKHIYTEKPIASTLEDGLAIEALEKTYGVTVTVGHSARLLGGIRADSQGDRGRRTWPGWVYRGELLQRACARTDPPDLALVQGPRARRSAVTARHPHVRRRPLSRRRGRPRRVPSLRSFRLLAPRSTISR